MSKALEAAAREMAIEGGFDPDEITANKVVRWKRYVPSARACVTAYLRAVGKDEFARDKLIEGWRAGMRDVLESLPDESITDLNRALEHSGARAALAALEPKDD